MSTTRIAIIGIGKIAQDQNKDYAKRKKMTEQEAEKWLGPNMGY